MLKSCFRSLIVDQWLAIDRHYRTESLPSLRPSLVLATAALALVLPRYFGQPRALERYPALGQLLADWLAPLPFPDLLPHLYWAGFKLINYGLLPYLCIKLVLRSNLRSHGVRWVREPRAWLLYLAMVAVVLPVAYLASTTESFLNTYPKYAGAGQSLTQLLIWEAAYGLQFLMLEFFFRGFLIFALARYVGSLAIFVMVVPYAMIHFGKPLAECLGSILAGTVLGTVALRTGSIWGGVFVHCAVAWSMDLFALAQTGGLQRLFNR